MAEKEKDKPKEKSAATKDREALSAEIIERIDVLGGQLVREIDKKDNPHIDIPVRGSANVKFDVKEKKIVLGGKIAKRYLFNVSHARRFMQTMLVASYVKKDLLENDLTATLRDLYYAKKRTIAGTKEDTIDEQKESDMAIVDFEVALDTFRERLHLRAEPKGRLAGSMTITDRVRDKVDTIDLSKMGSGGWAIPSIVEQIEFKKVDVDYVLVAEKNALFDRLNEDEYWKKNKCLILTTAGQAARGTRRFLQRLSQELKLPIYVLSIDGNEPIVLVDEAGFVRHPRIKDYVDCSMAAYGVMDGGYYERSIGSGNALQVSHDGKMTTGRILNAVRHPIFEELYEVTAAAGYSARVTASQSLMVFDSNRFAIVPKATTQLVEGDYLVCPANVPNNESLTQLNLIHEIQAKAPDLLEKIQVQLEGRFLPLAAATGRFDAEANNVLRYGKSELRFQSLLPLGPELCRLLGYYVAEGSSGDAAHLAFGAHETDYHADAARCVKAALGVPTSFSIANTQKTAASLSFGGRFTESLFLRILETGFRAEHKQVPPIIFNVPNAFKIEFLRGYFRGDGNLRFGTKGCRLWVNTISRKLAADVVLLIRQLGGWATVVKHPVRGKKMKHDAYHVCVSDRKTLQLLSNVVLDLARDNASLVRQHLAKQPNKLSIHRTLPSALLKPIQAEFYRLTRRGLSPLVNNQKRIAFEKLAPLFKPFAESGESVLYKDKVLAFLPSEEAQAAGTSEVAKALGLKFITAFKSLSRLEKTGFAASRKVRGDRFWFRLKDNAVDVEAQRKFRVLKNLVDDRIVLLPVKRIEKIKPTTELVYDIEVFPTHTFVGGLGGLQLKNTDADPYGWYIYSTMKYGSMALAHESDRLGCKEAHFIGMSISDIEHYDLSSVTIKAKDVDIKRAQEMKEYEWFKTKAWQNEINKFLEKKIKAEIQSLSSKSLQYVSNVYLPEKIKNQDFLP